MCRICGLDCSYNNDDTSNWSKITASPSEPPNFDSYKNELIINRHLAYREEKAYERLKEI